MTGSLTISSGILYVGREAKTATVCSYDLDGRLLETRIEYRDEQAGRSEASGLAMDADHRIWVADAIAGRVRCFTLFGQEVVCFGDEEGWESDRPGMLGRPADVLATGVDEELCIIVASGGRRRHAVQILHVDSGRSRSLRPLGNPEGHYGGVAGLGCHDELIYICEALDGRVQVFRGGEFHFDFHVAAAGKRGFQPVAIAPLADGRAVLATRGAASALLLVDAAGRLMRQLAGPGVEEGQVSEPGDLALEVGRDDRHSRLVCIDRDGERVQVFNLEGRCYGAFLALE